MSILISAFLIGAGIAPGTGKVLRLPPLRERQEHVSDLAREMLTCISQEMGGG
jgi:hypothetical protein